MIVFIFEPFVYVGAQLQFQLEREGGVFRADLRQLQASLAAGCICVYKHPLILDICRRVCLYTHRRSQEILF